jgi:hypothetical protein
MPIESPMTNAVGKSHLWVISIELCLNASSEINILFIIRRIYLAVSVSLRGI